MDLVFIYWFIYLGGVWHPFCPGPPESLETPRPPATKCPTCQTAVMLGTFLFFFFLLYVAFGYKLPKLLLICSLIRR